MQTIVDISLMILTVWWALLVLLWVVAMFYVIWILSKINHIVWDIKEKYDLFTWFIFRPLEIVKHFINKYNK